MQEQHSDGVSATKMCTGCGEAQPLNAFHKRAASPDGLSFRCKRCACEYQREQRKKPEVRARKNEQERKRRQDPGVREKQREAQRRWRARNPEKNTEYSRRWRETHPEKRRQANLKWREANPDYGRARYVEAKYGITLEEYDEIIARGCAICGKTDGSMHLDHCHDTGKVRDCLCHQCNVGLGHFKDDPAMLAKAVEYLRSHR